MPIESLDDMFVYSLEEIYYVENRLVEVLDELHEDAANDHLARGFAEHRDETREHVDRVERVFRAIDRDPSERESKVLEALVEERKDFRAEVQNDQLRDLYDMQAGMKTERIEMTGYQGLITLAGKLEYTHDVIEPLEDNLASERSTFRELEGLSKGSKLKSMLGQLMS